MCEKLTVFFYPQNQKKEVNRNDTMEAIDNIIPFLKGDADMIGLVCNTIRKLFCMSDEGYEIFLMDLEDYKAELEDNKEEELL